MPNCTNNGVEKCKMELDCVNIIEALRQLKVVSNMMLNDHQKAVIRFSKDKLISPQDKLRHFSLDSLVKKQVLNWHLLKIPSKNADESEVKKFDTEVDSFIDKFAKYELNKKDLKLLNSVI